MSVLTAALILTAGAFAEDKPGKGKPGAKPGGARRPGKPGESAGRGQMMGQLFKKADANNDGKVTLDEFKKATENAPGGRLKDMADKIFTRLDSDADGALSAEELKKAGENRPGRPGGKPGQKKPGADK